MTYEEWKRYQDEWTGGLRRGTREWKAAWKGLVAATGDRDMLAECPQTHECWGYLCSFRDRGRWVHEFRHRNHPVRQRRWYVHVPATPGWKPEDDKEKPKRKPKRRAVH
jgi:hypothetical protein